MADWGIGAGLGAIGFWAFLAICVGVGVWYAIRVQEARHETVRRLLESGQPTDQWRMSRLLGGDQQVDRDLKIWGLIVLCVAPGLAVLGWCLSYVTTWALLPLVGVAVVVGCVGIGLLVASHVVARSRRQDEASHPNGPMTRTLAPHT